jgi:hypothetical protein
MLTFLTKYSRSRFTHWNSHPPWTLKQEDNWPLRSWYRLANDFSRRAITYSTDIFPAISGLAKEAAEHIGQEYKAGLWLGDMNVGLLWSSYGPGAVRRGPKHQVYVGPSWSWASLDVSGCRQEDNPDSTIYPGALLVYRSGELSPIATVIEARIVNIGAPFSQVLSGSLEISGPVLEVCSCRVFHQYFDCYTNEALKPLDHYYWLTSGFAELHTRVGAVNMESLDMKMVPHLPCLQENDALHETLYYLHISWYDFDGGEHCENRQLAYCLVIRKTDDNTGRYERVGMAILQAAWITPASDTWPKRTVTII